MALQQHWYHLRGNTKNQRVGERSGVQWAMVERGRDYK
jgi:hypothetical protein